MADADTYALTGATATAVDFVTTATRAVGPERAYLPASEDGDPERSGDSVSSISRPSIEGFERGSGQEPGTRDVGGVAP